MHELGIARDLFGIVIEKAKRANLKNITKINIKVGVASGIDKWLLRHSLTEHILPQTLARDAELELIDERLELKCRNCNKRLEIQNKPSLSCPSCGSLDIEIIKGKDVYLESIEGSS